MIWEDELLIEDIAADIGLAFESAFGGNFDGIFASIFFVLCFANLGSIVYQLRIRRWPETTGQLITADTKPFGPTEINPSDVNYVNDVEYRYVVDGKKYIGRKYSPWVVVATRNLKLILEHQLKDIAAEDRIAVFYNPAKPQQAFLKRPGVLGILVTLGFAVFCFFTPTLVFGQVNF